MIIECLSGSFKGVGKLLRFSALFFIGALPYLLLVGFVAVIVLVIIKITQKNTRKRKALKNKTDN